MMIISKLKYDISQVSDVSPTLRIYVLLCQLPSFYALTSQGHVQHYPLISHRKLRLSATDAVVIILLCAVAILLKI